jgi:hypothetical protein
MRIADRKLISLNMKKMSCNKKFVQSFLFFYTNFFVVLCQGNGHVKQREIAELSQLLFSD